MKVINASFDGACPRNPGGPMGLGWVIDSKRASELVAEAPGNTNNKPEYLAVIRLLEDTLNQTDIEVLQIVGDSKLVCTQIDGSWKVKSTSIFPLYYQARSLLLALRNRRRQVYVDWVPREKNTSADIASKESLTS